MTMATDLWLTSNTATGITYDPATWSGSCTITYTPPEPEAKVDKEVEAKANEILKAEFEEKLLPYPEVRWMNSIDDNRMYTFCPKCGARVTFVKTKKETEKQCEHLMWICECSHEMLTKTKDAE